MRDGAREVHDDDFPTNDDRYERVNRESGSIEMQSGVHSRVYRATDVEDEDDLDDGDDRLTPLDELFGDDRTADFDDRFR